MQKFILTLIFSSILLGSFGVALAGCKTKEDHKPGESLKYLRADIQNYMQVLEENGFVGSMRVEQKGKTLLSEGYGFSNISTGERNSAQTVFDSGSLSKQFTAAAIMHLQEQNLVDVFDTIGTYFESVPSDKQGITLHHLLTHSSGLPNYVYDGDFVLISKQEAVSRALMAELEFPVGEAYLYSDTGYGLLAAIVEKASGMSFTDYLEMHIFAPAGMDTTGFYNDAKWQDHAISTGYANEDDFGPVSSRPGPGWGLLGFGSVLTTTDDLYAWYRAIRKATILSRKSIEQMLTPYVPEDESLDSYYGYGWVIADDPEFGRVIWHDGATDSQNAIFIMALDHQLFIAAMSNRLDFNPTIGEEVFYAIDAAFYLGQGILTGDFSVYPEFVER